MIIPEITLSADVIIKLLQHYHPGSHNFVHFVEHGNQWNLNLRYVDTKEREERSTMQIMDWDQAAEMGESFEARIEVGINKRINRS